MNPRIIIAGGSGFLGGVLAAHFRERGHDIVILTRKPKTRTDSVRELLWDGETLGGWTAELEGARALINLAGISVNCRYHARNRKHLLDSRLKSTRVLGEAIARCTNPPHVWLNSSTATIYKHNFGPAWDESGEIGGCVEAKDIFSVHVATEWERVFFNARSSRREEAHSFGGGGHADGDQSLLTSAATVRVRKIALRSAMVLGHAQNSVLPNMLRLARLGLGGSMSGGRQFVSWIHHEDFCRAVEWLIEHEHVSGVVNLAAPNPVTNAEFMRAVREICRAPFGLPTPLWLLEIGASFMRTETELIIKSRRVMPGRLLHYGFRFQFPELRAAVEDLTAKQTRKIHGAPVSDPARCG